MKLEDRCQIVLEQYLESEYDYRTRRFVTHVRVRPVTLPAVPPVISEPTKS